MKTKKLLLTLLLALTGSIATWADATTYYLKLDDTSLYLSMPESNIGSTKVTLSETQYAIQFVTYGGNTYIKSANTEYYLGYGVSNAYDMYSLIGIHTDAAVTLAQSGGKFTITMSKESKTLDVDTKSAGQQVYGNKSATYNWQIIDASTSNAVETVEAIETTALNLTITVPSLRAANKGVAPLDLNKAVCTGGVPSSTELGSFIKGCKATFNIQNDTEQAYLLMFEGINGALSGNSVKFVLTNSSTGEVLNQTVTVPYVSGWGTSYPFVVNVGNLATGSYTLELTFQRPDNNWSWTANVRHLRLVPVINAPADSRAAISLRDKLYLSTTAMEIDSGNEYAFGSMRNNNYAVLGLNNTLATDYSIIFESATNSSGRSIKVDVIKGDGTNELSETKSITDGSDWNGWHTYYVEGTLTEGAKSLKITGLSSGDNWTANVRNIHVVPVQTIPTEALSLAYGWKESGYITIDEAIGFWQYSGTADYRVKVSEDGDYLISFNASNDGADDSKVTFSLVSDDGTTAFTSKEVAITKNGDWNTFLLYKAEAKGLTAGTYTLKLSGTSSGWIANINQIAIQKAAAYTLAVSKDANIGTFVAPYDVTLPEGVTAYTVSQTGTDNITLAEVATGGSTLTANTPVILKTVSLTETLKQDYYDVITGTENAHSDGYLTGCYSALALPTDGTAYVLQWDSTYSKAEFRKVTSATTATAGRCYLKLSAESPARLLVRFSDDETTAISEIANGMNNDQTVYNLRGQKVMQPQKGIYIIHGKKTIVK